MKLPQNAIVYFSLVIEDYNIEDDAAHGDERAAALLDGNGWELVCMESRGLAWIARQLSVRITDEGHDVGGDLVCKFAVDTVEQLEQLDAFLSRYHTGGNDTIETGEQYISALDFRFYPNGVNDVFFGADYGAEADISDFIEAMRDGSIVAA
jgi:hypothetical protein